jgi:predicted transcriptional regulator
MLIVDNGHVMKNPNEVVLSCRVSRDIKRELKKLAREERRTLATFTAMMIEAALQERQSKEQAA